MEIKNKEELISVNCNLDKSNFDKFIQDIKKLGKKYEYNSKISNLKYKLMISGIKNPYMKVKGWCSRVIDNNGRISEVLFLDYDNILFGIVKEELRYLMDKFNLPPFYVFSTHEETDKDNGIKYGNYICINLKKNTFKQVLEMQELTHCDRAHHNIPIKNKWATWVLRLGNKGKKSAPKFKCIVGNINKNYSQEISNAHLKGLNQLYKIPKIKYTNKDKNGVEKLFINEYLTAST